MPDTSVLINQRVASSARIVSALSTRPLKVMTIMPLAERRGGGEAMLLNLIEHGRDAGIDWLVVFFSDGDMVATVRNWGVDARVIHTGRLRHPRRMLRAIHQMKNLIREQSIDAVFSWMGKGQLYGGAAAAWAGVPAIWYQLGLPDHPCLQDRVATAMPARGILTCSNAASNAQRKIWPYRPSQTVYPGVELDRFDPSKLPSPQQCRQKLGLPAKGPLIGIVGRLQQWKGMHHLVDAMPAVLEKHPDAHAVIVGGEHAFEPDYPKFLRGRITALNLDDRVILAGLQSNVPEWMQAMDVMVHASDREPFGIVVIEAMALGKHVIATNTAGPSEIIQHGINGLLWTFGNVSELSASILKCLDREANDTATNAAQSRAANFSATNFAAEVASAVKEYCRTAVTNDRLAH